MQRGGLLRITADLFSIELSFDRLAQPKDRRIQTAELRQRKVARRYVAKFSLYSLQFQLQVIPLWGSSRCRRTGSGMSRACALSSVSG